MYACIYMVRAYIHIYIYIWRNICTICKWWSYLSNVVLVINEIETKLVSSYDNNLKPHIDTSKGRKKKNTLSKY